MSRIYLCFIVISIATLARGAEVKNSIVMRISHQAPNAYHLTKILEGFASEVKLRTNGEIEVQLQGSEQAFKATENISAVTTGKIEAAVSTDFQWGSELPETLALNLPYVFENLEDIRRFPKSEARKYLDDKFGIRGVKNLAWFYISRQTIYTSNKRPIVNLEDLSGMKIRGLSKLLDTGLSKIGAIPTVMPAPEISKALASGALDVGMTDLSAAYSKKYYEFQKFGTVAPNNMVVYYVMYVDPSWYKKLSPRNRMAIEAAAARAEQEAIAITEQAAEAAIKGLTEKGMVLHVQTPKEASAWKRVLSRPTWNEFLKTAPERGGEILGLMSAL